MKDARDLLIIDDDEEFADVVSTLFETRGFKTQTADQNTFKGKMEKCVYDAVILDITMPGKSGYEVFGEIRNFDKRCAIIVLTQLTDDSEEVLPFQERKLPIFFKHDKTFIEKIVECLSAYKFKEPIDMSALIVDDNKDCQATYTNILERIGIGCIEVASSRTDAMKKLKTRDYDIYLIDIYLTEKGQKKPSGKEIIRSILSNNSGNRGMIIPISMIVKAKPILERFTKQQNVFPVFCAKHATNDLTDRIVYAVQRGPFSQGKANDYEKEDFVS